MKRKLIVLVGLPTSGKSWAGKYLNTEFGIPFYTSPVESHAEKNTLPWKQFDGFDERIMVEQLALDRELIELPVEAKCIAVEGWHIENFAYALIRSPQLEEQYRELISTRLSEFDVHVFYFSRTPEAIVERWVELSLEDVAIANIWFRKWLGVLGKVLQDFNFSVDDLYSDSFELDPLLPQRIRSLLQKANCVP
jgi:hypothetical protein